LNTGLTAYDALKHLRATGGKTVAVVGGNPCVGSNAHIAAKIALAMGNKAVVIGANANDDVESYVRAYGADFIVLGDA
jgi:D-arabinose 1-dehydrogenase-like Zn-dependent alcohol dehydrogenase